ncbi:EamA family transporter RarD [Solicola sp. PLA-1-18]|uniref:EamA family transporter RarD n=1 Tax=Solicola sp. PLA-1-18 TaxID=3380532 RepID=UPI003B7FA311
MDESRRGFLFGVGAYLCWGLFPLYWPLLEPAGAVEALSHRVVWSLVFVVVLVTAVHRWSLLRAVLRQPRKLLLVLVASVVIAFNWGGFIWGVNNGYVIEVSLGYFINPLVTILIGVVVLQERLRPVQWAALALAFLAVVGLTVDYGRPPWLALLVAFSFGTYGLMKKKLDLGATEGLALETMLLAPVALGYLVWLHLTGDGTFGSEGLPHALLLVGTGLVTAVPLLMFGAAATRVSLTTIGLLQYIAPTLQFVLGLVVFGEDMTPTRWLGFALVWTALAIITTEAVVNRRRVLRHAAEAATA